MLGVTNLGKLLGRAAVLAQQAVPVAKSAVPVARATIGTVGVGCKALAVAGRKAVKAVRDEYVQQLKAATARTTAAAELEAAIKAALDDPDKKRGTETLCKLLGLPSVKAGDTPACDTDGNKE